MCILVDGTPFALVLPFLFVENFQNMDDYLNKPYFATLMRIIRLLSFGISILLPGMYVAVALFHQEMLPDDMLYSIAMSESNTLFRAATVKSTVKPFINSKSFVNSGLPISR